MNPKEIYLSRRNERQQKVAYYARLDRLISYSRGVIFFFAIVVVWFATERHSISYTWLIPLATVFFFLMILHERVIALRSRFRRATEFYERGIARLEDRWAGSGQSGSHFLDERHPYAGDLDLFGHGSLFELICTAGTPAGKKTLAEWLLAPASVTMILQRQEAVKELQPRIDFREQLSLAGYELRGEAQPEDVARWGANPPVNFHLSVRLLAALLVCLTLAAALSWAMRLSGSTPFLVMLMVEAIFAYRLRDDVNRAVEGVERAAKDLQVLGHVLSIIEVEDFRGSTLSELKKRLLSGNAHPSKRIRQLGRLIDLLESKRNHFFSPLASLLLWKTQLAFAIDSWKRETGPAIARWIAVVGEIEALNSFATLHYERPDEPFPEVVEEGPCFEALAAGHPLIPAERCVRNDVTLNSRVRLLVVSGSNMSGKSTLLRTIGINTVLALSGAPVRASHLRISPMALGASLLIRDNLMAGVSHFYAEILRLRQILELTEGPLPLLFLLDEILHGTNSSDRLAGSEAYVRGLLARGAIGLVTTHDLALARIAEELAPQAANIHFVDHLVDGKIVFDYRIYPGVVQKSNALDLMRSIGLDV